jgi:hypothetical protein
MVGIRMTLGLPNGGLGRGVGVAVGAGVGLAVGVGVRVGVGVAVGVAVGVGVGVLIGKAMEAAAMMREAERRRVGFGMVREKSRSINYPLASAMHASQQDSGCRVNFCIIGVGVSAES